MMGPEDDLDALAGEYALGTLSPDEHEALTLRRGSDPAFDRAVLAWEARLGPLVEAAEPVVPPPQLLHSIEQRLFGAPSTAQPDQAREAMVIALRRQVSRWRGAAMAAAALAAAVTVAFVLRETGVIAPQNRGEARFVAYLQKDADSPAFVVSVDVATKELTIRPVAAAPVPGKSYELWLVNKDLPAPRSLGIVRQEPRATEAQLARYAPETIRNSLLAVTLEPEGGSPTGQATGPILFTGKLVQLGP